MKIHHTPSHMSEQPSEQSDAPISRRTLVHSLVAATSLSLPALVHAQSVGAANAANELRLLINRATRLSILSDRITRCQVQRFMSVLPARAERAYQDSMNESRQHLAVIRRAPASSAARTVAAEADKQTTAYLEANDAWKTTDRAGLAKLSVQADTVGAAVDQLVDAYVKDLGQANASILQTTADLQRLTQHLAVHYLLAQAKIDAAEQLKEVDIARVEFDKGLKQLRQSPLRTSKIEAGIVSIEGQWVFFNGALQKKQADQAALDNTSTTSERTLESLTELYALYEAALK